MHDYIEALKQKAFSKTVEESIPAITELILITNKITNSLLEIFEASNNRSVLAEKISMVHNEYFQKLDKYINHPDKDLWFWSATLIVHHQIKNETAEQILLNEVLQGELDKAYPATTMLCRVKNKKIKQAIIEKAKEFILV